MCPVPWTSSARISPSASSFCLYLFLKRNYEKIEVVFIRHHTRAEEVDEDTFFHSTESGGTVVSSALELMKKVMDERYSPTEWNIYGAQASDGDNWTDDSPKCRKILSDDILREGALFCVYSSDARRAEPVARICAAGAQRSRSMAMKKVETAADIYPVFRELFEKQVASVMTTRASAQRSARLSAGAQKGVPKQKSGHAEAQRPEQSH